MKTKYFAAAVLVGVLLSSSVSAAPINNIYNTGVDSLANAWLVPNVPDLHYGVITSPSGSFTPVDVDNTVFPFPPWFPNNTFSRWIGPAGQFANGPAGLYRYRTTFTVPSNANLSTVSVSGLWGTDDPGIDIEINGNSTGLINVIGFTSLTPFSINSGFVLGTNTIDFLVFNAGGPTGLRIDGIKGSYQVPEPTSVVGLVGGSVLMLLRMRRRVC